MVRTNLRRLAAFHHFLRPKTTALTSQSTYDLEKIEAKARDRLAQIERSYDLSQFTLKGFAQWLERQRGHDIVFITWPMPDDYSGVWFASNGPDFIGYERDTPSIHQVHIQIHEMCHIIFGHPTMKIGPHQLTVLCRANPDALFGELWQAMDPELEMEAETLALLIRSRVLKYNRSQELFTAIPSNENLAFYIQAMDV